MAFNLTSVWNYVERKEVEIKVFILIFYTVGIIGMLVPALFPLFIKLVPFALILSFLALTVFHRERNNRKSVIVFIAIYLLGFAVEVVGVNTGLLFGEYMYGNSLGIKALNTPIIIGLNWLLLIYITASVFEQFKIPNLAKIVLASSLMVGYDFILEIVAPRLDMWRFSDDVVPLQNYIVWFSFSIVLHSLIKIFRINTKNRLALIVLISQFVFFLVLAIFLG
ncbi:MAG: carotenoid biosynthesis protein [Tenuifilaceae bacterium]